MSTKLYDGLRLIGEQDVFDTMKTITPLIEEEYQKLAKKLVANEITNLIDNPPTTPPKYDMIFIEAQDKWEEDQKNYGDNHTLNDPLRFTIAFGKIGKKILAYPYYTQQEYGDILKNTGLFEEYGYWNNYDKPKNISEKEWEERAKDWDNLLNEKGTLGNLLLWKLDSKQPFLSVLLSEDKTLESINNTKRYENILHKEILKHLLEPLKLYSKEKREETITPQYIYSTIRKAQELAKKFLEETNHTIEQLPEPKTNLKFSELKTIQLPLQELQTFLKEN